MIVLVFGTGRSGTSTVARLLHEECKVHMGDSWVRQPDNFNPKGYYEDHGFGKLLDSLSNSDPVDMQLRLDELQALIEEVESLKTQVASAGNPDTAEIDKLLEARMLNKLGPLERQLVKAKADLEKEQGQTKNLP